MPHIGMPYIPLLALKSFELVWYHTTNWVKFPHVRALPYKAHILLDRGRGEVSFSYGNGTRRHTAPHSWEKSQFHMMITYDAKHKRNWC